MKSGMLLMCVFTMLAGCSKSDEIEHLTLQTKLHPKDARAFHRLGFAYHMEDNYKQAEHHYIKAISLGDRESYLHLGRIFEQQGKTGMALDMYRKAVAIGSGEHAVNALRTLEERLDKRTPEQRMADILEKSLIDQEREAQKLLDDVSKSGILKSFPEPGK